jgi:hypothetical protein
MEKEYLEVFCGSNCYRMNNFHTLECHEDGSMQKQKFSAQQKGFKEEMEAFSVAVQTGKPAIPYIELLATSRICFAVLDSLRTGEAVTLG